MEENNLLDDNLDLIKKVSKSISNARKITLREKNLTGDEKLSELDYVIEALKISLKSADSILVSETHKSTIPTSLNQIDSFLQNFVGNPVAYITHLDSALSQANNIKNVFPYLVSKVDETGLDNVRKLVYGIRQSASNQMRSLSDEFEKRTSEILEQVESLKTVSIETNDTIKSQKDRLDNAIAEFQKQFSERIAEYQKQFSEGEEERRKKVETSIQSRDKAYNKETKERNAEIETWKNESETISQNLIELLRKFAKEAEITVGLMSEKSLQNDYIIQANKEKNSARLWNLATFLTVLLLLVAIGYIFVHTIVTPLPLDQASYPQVLSKFLITAVIGIVARWTSRQANRHLAEERRLRRLALELATINPFINSLEPAIQSKIKEILAMKYYGNSIDEKAPFGEISPIHDAESGIKSVPETILDSLRGKK